jgi:hypothetical protein
LPNWACLSFQSPLAASAHNPGILVDERTVSLFRFEPTPAVQTKSPAGFLAPSIL